jgi:hypothetical protein
VIAVVSGASSAFHEMLPADGQPALHHCMRDLRGGLCPSLMPKRNDTKVR